jgi:D-alanine-D-alanine ligase
MKAYKVALLANLKKNAPKWEGMPPDQWDDLDSEKTISSLVGAIRAGGHTCEFLEGDSSLLDTLRSFKPDICFNISEGHYGDSREAQVPAILEMMRIPYTGSRVLTLALALDKPMTKRVFHYHDLPSPPFQTMERDYETLDPDLDFPLFVKPSREGTGMGVSASSIVHNEDELRRQVNHINQRYNQPALIECFIEGREVTVGVVGNLVGPTARRIPRDIDLVMGGLKFLPPLEIDLAPYQETDATYTNRLKVEKAEELNYLCPAPLDEEIVTELYWLTAAVFRVTGALDVARVDFRLSANENLKPYILEINPLPGLAPVISDLVIEAKAAGIEHTELVNMILNSALKRYGMI